MGIHPEQWEYAIVGDGSGVGWDMGCGWASTLVRRVPAQRWPFRGGMDPGTISLAEIMAFLQPLLFMASTMKPSQFQRVHIFSDSQYVVNIGKGTRAPKSHAILWRQLAGIRGLGFEIDFHWIPRDCIDLNKFADAIAGEARKAISGIDMLEFFSKVSAETLDEINP